MTHVSRLLRCGHVAREVADGRCWPCFLAFLRADGQGAKADRLERHQQLKDEGQVSWERLVLGLIAAYEQRP